MELNSLPPSTRALWSVLSRDKSLHDFVLIGGTALSMRIGHRISEDLDFACLDRQLPRQRLKTLLHHLESKAYSVRKLIDVASQDDFIDAGLDQDDFQQNFVVENDAGAVKLSFVAFEERVTRCLRQTQSAFVRVADLDEIFRTKVLCACERSKTRDWLDLYVLLKHHGFMPVDIYTALEDSGSLHLYSQLDRRLRKLQPTIADEGYSHLLKKPPSLTDMQNCFNNCLDDIESQLAARRFS